MQIALNIIGFRNHLSVNSNVQLSMLGVTVPLWSSHTKRKANAKATSFYWVHSISSLPATPSESYFTHNIAGNWIQNPFCRDFASENRFRFRSGMARLLQSVKKNIHRSNHLLTNHFQEFCSEEVIADISCVER